MSGPDETPSSNAEASGIDPTAPVTARRLGRMTLFAMQVLWPAFLGAVASVGLVFSLLDPLVVEAVRDRLGGSREGAYTIAFLGFWGLHAFACALTWSLSSTERRRARSRASRGSDDARRKRDA